MIEILEATKSQAAEIARLIMTAMTDDCCLYFCGEGYGLEDLTSGRACSRSAEQASLRRSRLLASFYKMMTLLVEREDSQYSYRNTLVAMDAERVVGIAVSYDGGRLHELRRAFIEAAKEHIGKDHSGMDDETQAGELYLDSLAVLPEYRRQGIARKLLLATKERADRLGLPCVGLLVDKDNPVGEALYTSVGFQYVNDNQWGGHPMKHLVL
jgi:DNA-3-methyladenine glycosylase I